MNVRIDMISCEGREAVTEDTLRALSERGGLDQSALPMRLNYFGNGTVNLPNGDWVQIRRQKEKRRNRLYQFFEIIKTIPTGEDWIFVEDDISPCQNALRFVAEYPMPPDIGLISFFDFRNEWPKGGVWRHVHGRDYWGAQVQKIAARVIPYMQELARKEITLSCQAWDIWFSRAIWGIGLNIATYSPSLFQHTGTFSLYAPSSYGGKRPTSKTFPGEKHDAFAPWDGNQGTHTARGGLPCKLHGGVVHPNGFICPSMRSVKRNKPRP